MNYEHYEDAIVDLLKMKGVTVGVLPHVAVLNDARPTAQPQLFVIINGGNFAEPENLAVTSQLETIQGEIFIRAKNRRGKLGIFDLYEKISELLLGYRILGAKTVVTFNQFGYVAGIQNNWQYALTFSFDAYKVEVDRSGDTGTIREITINATEK